jgi:group II intron reverse transcriptase/maturase
MLCFIPNKQPQGMIDYAETKSQPIDRLMVWAAYWKVRSNKGCAGIDNKDWAYFDKNRNAEIYKLWNRLTSGSYFPQAVKRVSIPKKGGGERSLGIPTISDRIAQEVVKTHLERIVEPLFHNSSFGYRPGRNCHQAVQQAYDNTWTHGFGIEVDIKGFFDYIDHALLVKAVRHYCHDKWVCMYIERWLTAGVLQTDGTLTPTFHGTPQGGVVSPLLANIFLHVVIDKWMEINHPSIPFERYADDILVHCKSEKQALYILDKIKSRMKACNLSLHPDKTRIIKLRGKSVKRYSKGIDFLGFTIRPKSIRCKDKVRAIPSIHVSRKSKKAITQKFREMYIHKKRATLTCIAKFVNPVARGIINYYHKFKGYSMHQVWYRLNIRLLKWIKQEKGFGMRRASAYLRTKYKENPTLFVHWKLAHP